MIPLREGSRHLWRLAGPASGSTNPAMFSDLPTWIFWGVGGEDGGVEATGKSVGGVKAGGGEPA